MGLPRISLSPYDFSRSNVPRGFEVVRSERGLWSLHELSSGKWWYATRSDVLVNLAKSYAYTLNEFARILVSPEGLPLAEEIFPQFLDGWNDDGTEPYNAAYNAQLLIDHPLAWR